MSRKDTNLSRRNFLKTSATGVTGSLIVPTIVPYKVFGKDAPSNKINIGQIGFGRVAMGHDLPETMKNNISRVIAVSDVDVNRYKLGKDFIEEWYAKRRKKKNYIDVKCYRDYREMLQDKNIDAVIISTPDHWHSQPAIEAALAGKDIYLQKPTSLTIKEGRQLSNVIQRTGRILQLGSQQRSDSPWPHFRRACELVRNGRIGRLHTIYVGLPGDPSGPEADSMSVPENLDYDMWLGATPYQYYTEIRVHPQKDFSRPGWLRCEQFGSGMITGWGTHHIDIAHWAMGTEFTGPIEVEGAAEFPTSGLWDVHGKFSTTAKYANGVTMHLGGDNPNGVKFVGEDGWIFVSRGAVRVTSSDPNSSSDLRLKALDASDPGILESEIGKDEIHLYSSPEQHKNWLDCIVSREEPIATAEIGHRSCSACLINHIAMKIDRKLYWDPEKERFKNDDEANAMLSRPQRYPYGTNLVLKGFTGV